MPRYKSNKSSNKRKNPCLSNLKQFQIKREKVPEDDDSIHVMNQAFLEDISPDANPGEISDEINPNNASNSTNLSDFENSDDSHSDSVYLETDYDPENSDSDSDNEKEQPNISENVDKTGDISKWT